ncbi:MAG TPA: long chain acyl-CoA synthetase [Desulfocapsa sulfexigens]|nr:long chain acyl-CoA synthetase [Desulfocapsa sulfexigens]
MDLSGRPQRLLGEGLLASATSHPEKVAVIVEGEPYTYSQLLKAVLCLKAALQSRGLMRGDRVAIYMDNTWPCIVSVYAVLLAGGVFLVINPQTKSEKLHFLLENSDARILLTDGHIATVFVPVVQSISTVEHVIYSGVLKLSLDDDTGFAHFDTVISEHAPSEQFAQVIPNDLAALLYTSGSTGNPKGVMQTHQAMVFAAWSLIEYLRLSPSEKIMLVLPLAFDYGLYQLLMTIKLGATLIVERSFTFPAQIYNRMLEESITVFPGVPTIFAMMVATNRKKKIVFPSVTRVTNTAAALTASMIPELKQIFPNALIYKMYGQTECKRISYLEPELIDSKPASVGKAIPGTELFLLSPEGKAVEHGEPGILYVRGPHVMAGYWKQPETTARMLKDGLLPGERILCTHDWFHMDDEGFLYFEGRSDDIIKTRGEKVSPLEVENVLQEIPGIKEAAVIGVTDETLGQAVKAFIVVEESMTYKERQLKKMCLANLENFMVPQSIVCLAEMPKTQNGKIDKKKLIKI